MIKENETEFKNMNLDFWHSKGYTGKGVNVLHLDVSGFPFEEHNVIRPLAYIENQTEGSHNPMMLAASRELAPDTNLYSIRINGGALEQAIDWIIENKDMIDVVNISVAVTKSTMESLKRLKDTDIPLIVAVGNDGNDRTNLTATIPFATGIGAWTEYRDELASYSNWGMDMLFVAYSHIKYISPRSKKLVDVSGTSGAAVTASSGIVAIYAQYFKEVMRRKMTRLEVFEFMIRYAEDKMTPGKDLKSGYGLVRLPDHLPTLKKPIEIPKEPEKETDNMKFKDTNGHWADGAIDFISDKGLLKGYEDGTFKPERAVTRAELATVLARINGYVEKK